MPKIRENVDFAFLDRMFIGTHDERSPSAQHWYEVGYLLKGVDIMFRRIRQQDKKLRQRTKGLGFSCEGSFEPLQNKISDYRFYDQVLNGLRNFAFLCGDQLWICRLKYLSADNWQDNRIQIVTDLPYNDSKQKAASELSGWIKTFERFQVKDLKLNGDQLIYTIVGKTADAAAELPGSLKFSS